MTARTSVTVAERPGTSAPRPYEFPPVAEHRLPNGLRILEVDMPGRPLVSASLLMLNGAVDEPADAGGATVLAARALSEGTERYDAIQLTEASERLGASIHAEAGWDALTAGVDVPRDRLEGALELLAEMVLHPTFPEREVDRLRDERLNDLLQAKADPRRRAEEAFVETIYASNAPYHRPAERARPSRAWGPPSSDAHMSVASIRRGPRSSSAASSLGWTCGPPSSACSASGLRSRPRPIAAPLPTRRHATSVLSA